MTFDLDIWHAVQFDSFSVSFKGQGHRSKVMSHEENKSLATAGITDRGGKANLN